MKRPLIHTLLFALCATASACAKEQPAQAAPVADGARIPMACEQYFKRAEACLAKAKIGPEQAGKMLTDYRGQMAAVPAAQMEAACTKSNEAFTQTVIALKCE